MQFYEFWAIVSELTYVEHYEGCMERDRLGIEIISDLYIQYPLFLLSLPFSRRFFLLIFLPNLVYVYSVFVEQENRD